MCLADDGHGSLQQMTAAYSTFGNELQPMLVMAGIQPGKTYDLAEKVKDQGMFTGFRLMAGIAAH
jgi:hypothetical protein